jgi:uncharacterized repeat protein (TIGR03803 family)
MSKSNCGNWVINVCAVPLLWATAAIALPAQTPAVPPHTSVFTTLYNFCSQANCTDGASPSAGLVQSNNRDLYGTTARGANNSCDGGCGTVFKVTPSGGLTTLYSFCTQTDCTDGASPQAELIQATDGNLYGTTYNGGITTAVCPGGCGTVFKMTPSGTVTTLYSFCAGHGNSCTDGVAPFGLVQAANGSFYGTTLTGGAYCSGIGGCGTVFKITSTGQLATLHSFDSLDGQSPRAGLVQGTSGDFYGTTSMGGAHGSCDYGNGCGTVFKITAGGMLTTLYSFRYGGKDGRFPIGALVQGADGNFYGTTAGGGANGWGTVFRITPSGKLATLYAFCSKSHCADGGQPEAALFQGTDGIFYGTTYVGGRKADGCASGCGTVFKITPSGTLTTLHTFAAYPTDGAYPAATMVQDTNGTFYGTTLAGGASNSCAFEPGCGTVFSLSVGLGPFVETNPMSGPVGKRVKILGTNLSVATGVAFNGTPAVFTVVSGSEITTTVPSGATTGRVWVTFPHGRRSSNVPFRVR